ncbi:Uncharacterised protein [Mycobacteroides abscessus subsp. abscessus]|nr:Uncharacterised protein [Mycobacteroides abscessus subsp. abscessus]
MVAVCSSKRGSRARSESLVVPGMPPTMSLPSKRRGSIGLMRGAPLRRRVERKHRLRVSAWRRVKTSATVGASRVNSRQEVMVPR